MAFQWIFDTCETMSIARRKMVATTTSRNGVVKAVSRGNVPQTFEVKLPDGLLWSEIRDNLIAAEASDKIVTESISIRYANIPWYYGNVAPSSDEQYVVRCVSFPKWTIFARNQVSWDGPFIFQEIVT
jgi:hypothetical protein